MGCAHKQLNTILQYVILKENPLRVMVLSKFTNLLNHEFATECYDYHLFARCGFLDVVIREGFPREPIPEKIS